jgi:tripartite-type tricarboxylate transporter receptor subunit TctC
MRRPLRQFPLLVCTVTVLAASLWAVSAQTYPTRPVTIIVPYAAGGPTDLIARAIAEKMREPLGQAVVVENVAGGGGAIGVGRVAHAVPDGYTLDLGNNGSNVLTGAMYPLAFDLMRDFAPIAGLTTNPQIIISKKTIAAKDLAELIIWLKQNQRNVSVGIAGLSLPSVSSTSRS